MSVPAPDINVLPQQFVSIPRYNFVDISTNATTVVKSASGIFHSIVINGAGSAWTVTAYDNTAASGTKIINSWTVAAGQPIVFDALFQNGLTIVTAGTTAGDITITYL